MKTLTKLIVPLLLGALAACGGSSDSGPVTVSPKSVTVKAGDSTAFSATVQDAKESKILWSVEGGDSHGTITSTGVYTAPTEAGSYTVVATNAVDTTKKDTASVTVQPAATVVITPANPTVGSGGSVTFSAQVSGATDTSVTWSVQEGAAGGSITATGVYTAPATPGTYTIVATSVADASRKATTLVRVEPVTISVTPSGLTVDQGAVVELSASVSGTHKEVVWSVEGGDANGTVTASGLYTAPAKEGTFTVTAASTADATKKGSATITVRAVAVALSPTSASLGTRGSVAFYATVTGTRASTAVTWRVEGTGSGSITPAGVYTAPEVAGTYTVTATSVADTTKKASAQVTVGAVGISITPASVSLEQGATTTFSATVTGTSTTEVKWSVEGTGNGTISSSGAYTAPSKEGTFTVIATSVADPTKKASAQVMVAPVTVTISPATASIEQGASTMFSATVTGTSNTEVKWSVEGAGNGTITTTGAYTAPNKAGTFTVIATSVASPTQKATAQVTVSPVSVSVSSAATELDQGASTIFSASVTGSTNTNVTWSVEGAGNGTITPSGVYTAPNKAGTFTIIATSKGDPTQKGSAQVTVAAVAVSVSPASVAIEQGTTASFSATVTGSTNTAVTWSVVGTDSGTITSAGVYTAPKKAGTFTVKATSKADTTQAATAQVTVGAVSISITPASATLEPGASTTFTATVTGSSNTDVKWSVEGTDSGTITSSGVYTAPTKAGTYTIKATSAADPTQSATAQVTVGAVSVTLSPKTASAEQGATVQFTATVTGSSNTEVKWSVEGAGNGTITTTGLYTAPAKSGTFTVKATSVASPGQSDTAQVTVNAPTAVAISVSPSTVTSDQGATTIFNATVTGTSNTNVTWSVEGTGNGTITSSGVYTAPNKAGSYTVTATSSADTTKKVSAAVTVRDVSVSVSPTTASIEQGTSTSFSATVTGSINTGVTWSVEGTGNGTISSSGTYLPPNKGGTFTVVATSKADPTKTATAQVTVGDITVSVSPATASLEQGATTTFTATVTGASNKDVKWSVEGTGNGTITSSGVYTAPTKAGTFTITATSVANPAQKASATVTVGAITVSVSPATASSDQGATTVFTATVTGTSNTAVTWSVEGGDTNGTLTSSGIYTAPNKAGTFTVTATSVASPAQKATAQVTVAAFTLTLTPASQSVAQGGTATYTATVTGAAQKAVTWSVEGGDTNGTVSSSGVYTAPNKAGTFTLTATSVADPTKKATATATVSPASGPGYTDPTAPGWRLVKNTTASSGNKLVLDLVGPTGQSGRGVDLTLAVDSTKANWIKVSTSDTEFVANQKFVLGSGTPLLKGLVQTGTLKVGVFQKGGTATAYSGGLISVALELKLSSSLGGGTVIPLTVVKAHALPATGALAPIDVAVGTLTAQ